MTFVERAREERDRVYGPPLPGGLLATSTSSESFWERNEAELREHFAPEVYLASSTAKSLFQPAEAPRVEDWLLLLDGERLAGVTCGSDSREQGTYTSGLSILHPDYRGRGIYAELQKRLIAYTHALGYRRIESQHAPSNNAVLIAKLRAGFHVYSLELDAFVGPTLRLRYFHDPDEHAAYLFRNGNATLTSELIRSGFGAMQLLREQFRASDESGVVP